MDHGRVSYWGLQKEAQMRVEQLAPDLQQKINKEFLMTKIK